MCMFEEFFVVKYRHIESRRINWILTSIARSPDFGGTSYFLCIIPCTLRIIFNKLFTNPEVKISLLPETKSGNADSNTHNQ